MYRLTVDDNDLYIPGESSYEISDAKITINSDYVAYLDFSISKKNKAYDLLNEKISIIKVYKDSVLKHKFFIDKIDDDFDLIKKVSCTSVIEYLSDTLVRPYSTIESEQGLTAPSSVNGYFQWLIDQHNKVCDTKKKFYVGVNQGSGLDNNNYIYRSSTQVPTVSSELKNKILDVYPSAYITLTFDGDKNILNLYSDVHDKNDQIIDFGKNLLDFAKTINYSDIYTAVRPTGYTDNSNNSSNKLPLTIESIPNGISEWDSRFYKKYDVVYAVNAVNSVGYREIAYSNTDIKDAKELYKRAVAYLQKVIIPTLSIEIKAIDLSLLSDSKYTAFDVGQAVRIRSIPHGIDEYLTVSSIELNLMDPSSDTYTLGKSFDSLTGQQSSYLSKLNATINSSFDTVGSAVDATKKIADAANKASKEAIKSASDAVQKADDASQKADNASQKANDASQKADDASQKADDASQKAEAADNKATSASQQANSAFTASKDAADKAIAASKAADEASAKATLAETNSSEAKETSKNAIKAANDANTAATTATTTANKASEDAANAIKSAQSANNAATDAASKADAATTEVDKVKSQIDDVNGEITDIKSNATQLRDDLTGQITSVKETMEADYAKTTDLTATSETLRNEITSSAAGTLQTVSSTYAKKTELETTTTLAQEAKDAASTNAKDLTNAINKVNTDMSSLQDQIDGAIETWFFDGAPSNDNKPASDWTTDTLKKNHLGDLYYDNLTGYSYRWQIQNGVYSWARITDVDVTKALKDAKNAQETANSKRRVFSSTPYPPYDEGDLWVQGASGDILRCTVAKSADQTYADADWSLASKYTDDSAVTTLKNTIETTYATKTTVETLSDKWSSTASSVETVKIDLKAAQESAKQANAAATAAQESANTAIENAATAQTKADEAAKTASDATENAATANTAAANAQKAADDAAKKAATAQSNADTANAELATAKTKLEEIQNQANATDEQVAAAKAAVEKAQTAADKANEAASTANTAASDAKKAADTAKKNAATAQSTADTAKANAATAQSTADTAKANAATAQSTADTAKKTADKATQDLAAVTNRVTIAETNISNNAEAINLRATKTEVNQAVNDASDSSKSYTDAQLKIASESITSTVSKTYATKADLDTTNANVTNAQNTADSVKDDLANNYTTTTDMNSKIEQSASSITATVSKTYATKASLDKTNKNVGAQTATVRNVDSYMQFADPNGGAPQLTIGTSTSDMKTALTNEQLRFEKNGVALLTVDGASSSVKAKNLTLSGYQWKSLTSGQLRLVYIGGE